uniref:Caspase-1 n=1 Tax=Clastoptera arizonana TaxID=38151 RepID=A0A1B6DZR3_9HEMI
MMNSRENCNERNIGDATDAFGTSVGPGKNSQNAAMPVPKNAIYYNMEHKKRGLALIFNHENFTIPHLKARTGTNADAENLKKTLINLGFEVRMYYDLTMEELDKVIEKASLFDHTDCDCLLMAVLSHGEQGILYAKNVPYKNDVLWMRFTADKCPTLAGKPKLFFIQACQGDKLDGGVTLTTQVDGSPSYKIPAHADFVIAYSTIPGFYSWRNTSRGSWFMQALCQELNEYGYTCDLLTILTSVNRRVAIDYESNVPDNSTMHAQKQIPCITFMLTRLLKFSQKF